MSGNSGAWGVAMWQNNKSSFVNGEIVPDQEQGISLSGGDEVDEFLPTVPLGCLLVPPEGLGVPPVRSGDVTFAQRDGVEQFGDYYEPRILTFQVLVCNDGCPGCPSGRQKAKRLTREWSRSCASATLVLFTDCHQPDATEQEKPYLGPYLVRGRPRVADLTWMRSNRGCARLTLRFDATDARLILPETPEGSNWHSVHVVSMDAGTNMAQNYRLDGLTMTEQDATVDDSTITLGAPDGGSYFRRQIVTANTVSPMVMDLADPGVDGIPVTAGNDYTVSWWARKDIPGGLDTRVDIEWFDAGGVSLGTDAGVEHDPGSDWQRFSQTHTAPPTAAFMQPMLLLTGIAVDGQNFDLAQAWINEGSEATGPAEVEVAGDLCAFPVFRLDPDLTGPITISYGEFSFTYDEDVTGSQVVIDIRWGRASELGADLTQNLTGSYDFPLSPGTHDFSFTTGDPNDSGSVQIEWENAVISG